MLELATVSTKWPRLSQKDGQSQGSMDLAGTLYTFSNSIVSKMGFLVPSSGSLSPWASWGNSHAVQGWVGCTLGLISKEMGSGMPMPACIKWPTHLLITHQITGKKAP